MFTRTCRRRGGAPAGCASSHTTGTGRLSRIDYVGTRDYVEYGYDAAGRRTSMTDTRLPSADLGGQTYTWEDDVLDRVTTETYPGGSTIVYAYDALGRRTSMTDPDGNVTQYSYANTANNKKQQSIQHPFSATTEFDYSEDKGLVTAVWLGNGAAWEGAYDDANTSTRSIEQGP